MSVHVSAQDQHWSHSMANIFRVIEATDMVDVVATYEMDYYIFEKLRGDCVQKKAGWKLLTTALLHSYKHFSRMDCRMLIDEILRHGADINETVAPDGRIVWEIFINELRLKSAEWPSTRIKSRSVIGDIIIMLLSSGADPQLVSRRRGGYLLGSNSSS
ncbi:hypothetical protein BKA80DRAFT_286622 [Phyllosticta citrichinensis]